MNAVIRQLTVVAVLLCLAVAAVFVPARAAGQDGPVLYVVADVVKLREWPTRDDVVVANLRIGTPVRLLDGGRAPEGWTKVAVAPSGAADYDVYGYVASAFLSERPPAAGALLDRYRAQMAAGDPAAARSTAQRLFALDPADPDHAERLRVLYERLGYEEGVARLTAHLRGDGVKYLGVCGSGGSAVLLAEYRPADEFDPQARPGQTLDHRLTRYEGLELAQRLQRMPWFGFDPTGDGGSQLMRGAWIMDSGFLMRSAAEVNWRMRRSAECVPGTVFSNEPLRAVASAPLDGATVDAMVEAVPAPGSGYREYTVQAVRGRRILDGPSLASVGFEIAESQGIAGAEEGFIWGLFSDAEHDPLASFGVYYGAGTGYSFATRVTWVAWDRSPARVAIVEGFWWEDKGYGLNNSAIQVFVVEEEGGRVRLRWIR